MLAVSNEAVWGRMTLLPTPPNQTFSRFPHAPLPPLSQANGNNNNVITTATPSGPSLGLVGAIVGAVLGVIAATLIVLVALFRRARDRDAEQHHEHDAVPTAATIDVCVDEATPNPLLFAPRNDSNDAPPSTAQDAQPAHGAKRASRGDAVAVPVTSKPAQPVWSDSDCSSGGGGNSGSSNSGGGSNSGAKNTACAGPPTPRGGRALATTRSLSSILAHVATADADTGSGPRDESEADWSTAMAAQGPAAGTPVGASAGKGRGRVRWVLKKSPTTRSSSRPRSGGPPSAESARDRHGDTASSDVVGATLAQCGATEGGGDVSDSCGSGGEALEVPNDAAASPSTSPRKRRVVKVIRRRVDSKSRSGDTLTKSSGSSSDCVSGSTATTSSSSSDALQSLHGDFV